MGLYKVGGSPYWHYSFKLEGRPQQRGSTGYEDKKLAQAKYVKVRNESQQNQDFRKAEKISIRELLEWTNKNYWQYDHFEWQVQSILHHFGNHRAESVALQDLLDYREKRLREVEPPSVNKEFTLLRAAYNYAIKGRKLFKNPVADLAPLDCSERKRDKFLRPDEKQKLLSAARENLRDIILFALKTGMRQGEILGLKWADVDTQRNQMKVISYKGGKAIIRYVPIFRQTQEILDRQDRRGEWVFSGAVGEKLGHHSCVKSTFMRLVKKLGIQGGDFHFHDLRHTFASDYLMMGGTLSALQDILGHRRADTTRRYAHLSKEHLKVEMDKLPYEIYTQRDEQKLPKFYHNGSTVVFQNTENR